MSEIASFCFICYYHPPAPAFVLFDSFLVFSLFFPFPFPLSSIMNGRNVNTNRFPFTPSQWQELEHQALIYKYMASGISIPPDLLFTIKRTTHLDSSRLLPHHPQHCKPILSFSICINIILLLVYNISVTNSKLADTLLFI